VKKSVALFFGSFNPIHLGHLVLAEIIAGRDDIDEAWLVVSPHNPLKSTADLAAASHRFEMVNLAIAGNPKLQACDVEMQLPLPSYTDNTLKVLTSNFPKFKFTVVIGEDQLYSFHQWKNYSEILEKFQLMVYPRHHSFTVLPAAINWKEQDVIHLDAPRLEISATYIRERCRLKQSIRYLVAAEVEHYIQKHDIY
jgi:nicotinate-nucleotide adenylyltransferase